MLGATGSVGQRFILLLSDHPFLELHAVGASERSLGKKYKDAVRWKQCTPMSEKLSNLVLRECKAEQFKDCDLVFSGLNSDIAGETGTIPSVMKILAPVIEACSKSELTVRRDGVHQG